MLLKEAPYVHLDYAISRQGADYIGTYIYYKTCLAISDSESFSFTRLRQSNSTPKEC